MAIIFKHQLIPAIKTVFSHKIIFCTQLFLIKGKIKIIVMNGKGTAAGYVIFFFQGGWKCIVFYWKQFAFSAE